MILPLHRPIRHFEAEPVRKGCGALIVGRSFPACVPAKGFLLKLNRLPLPCWACLRFAHKNLPSRATAYRPHISEGVSSGSLSPWTNSSSGCRSYSAPQDLRFSPRQPSFMLVPRKLRKKGFLWAIPLEVGFGRRRPQRSQLVRPLRALTGPLGRL